MKAFQDRYPDDVSHCYGCGRLNEQGLQIKTYWEGEETVTRFTPRPYHTAIPGYVNGGLVASLIDCHSTGSAAAAAYRYQDKRVGEDQMPRYVTASLKVDYLRPTPMGMELEIRGEILSVEGRKVKVASRVTAGGQETATGEVLAVQMPDDMVEEGRASP